jgi:trimethylamine:corrinoid methyltransferase-like protein
LVRPTLNVLSDELIGRILDEAMGILATVGMEVRGPVMRQRLIDAGLPTDPAGRVLFPRDVVERAIASAPSSGTHTPTSALTGSISCPGRAGCACSTTGPARRAWRTRPISSSTSGWPTG